MIQQEFMAEQQARWDTAKVQTLARDIVDKYGDGFYYYDKG